MVGSYAGPTHALPPAPPAVKIRRLAEDFEVTELTSVTPAATGRFGLYRLTKRSVGTPEAIDALLRAWDLPRAAVSFGGLKDRHALTRQHLTIESGPRQDLALHGITLEHLGRLDHPFTAKELAGNRFRVVLRDMGPDEERAALAAVPEVALDGVPNYFDDQRFGSMTLAGEHVAAPWIRADYERTLQLAFAEPNEHDRGPDREVKELLRAHWGDFVRLKAELPRSNLRSIITFLADRPGDYKGALAITRQDMRSLWLAAIQSQLFNSVLRTLVEEQVEETERVVLAQKAGPLVFWKRLTPEARALFHPLELPLPSSRVQIPPGPVADLVTRVLAAQGLTLRDINIKHPRGSFFSKGWRAVVLRPTAFTQEAGDDALYPGRRAVTLAFDLPKGAYATIVVKRLTEVALA